MRISKTFKIAICSFFVIVFVIVGVLIYQKGFRKEVKIPETKSPKESLEGEIKKCEDINTSFFDREICYIDVFKKGASDTVCKEMEGEKEIVCYMAIAIAKSDGTFCEKITNKKVESKGERMEREVFKRLCDAELAISKPNTTEEGDFARCRKINKSGFLFEEMGTTFCYRYMFYVKGYSELLCEENEWLSDKGICYLGAALAKKDETVCDKVSNWNDRDLCYTEVNVNEPEAEVCKRTELKADCYLSLARSRKNELLCEKAGEHKDICYRDLALSKNSETLCEKAGRHKQECYGYFKK